ncbi:MAG: hypothetical protein LBF66_00765 [Holosporales bacterium]|jgi:hypothetical protein|nr:hypothetical protein [Holosporales bacterium]
MFRSNKATIFSVVSFCLLGGQFAEGRGQKLKPPTPSPTTPNAGPTNKTPDNSSGNVLKSIGQTFFGQGGQGGGGGAPQFPQWWQGGGGGAPQFPTQFPQGGQGDGGGFAPYQIQPPRLAVQSVSDAVEAQICECMSQNFGAEDILYVLAQCITSIKMLNGTPKFSQLVSYVQEIVGTLFQFTQTLQTTQPSDQKYADAKKSLAEMFDKSKAGLRWVLITYFWLERLKLMGYSIDIPIASAALNELQPYIRQPGSSQQMLPMPPQYIGQPGSSQQMLPMPQQYIGQPGSGQQMPPMPQQYIGQPGSGQQMPQMPQWGPWSN